MSLQTYKRRDNALQLAFVAAVVTIVIEIVLSIITGIFRSEIFGSGGESLLLQNGVGIWNTPLITGLIILAVFIFATTASPLLRPATTDLHPARAIIYILSIATIIYLTLTYFLIPTWTGHVPALQSAYWPVSIGLATSIGFIVTSQPVIAERGSKRRTPKTKPVETTKTNPEIQTSSDNN